MGNPFSQFTPNQKPLFIMTGLDAAGKTSILYKLKLGVVESIIPTIGFKIEKLQSRKFDIISWDIGRDRLRILWKDYYENSKGIIYVIDCSDKQRMAEAKSELHGILIDPLFNGQPLLIYANKQDLFKMNSEELAVELMLHRFSKNCYIQLCCTITGEGLQDGLNWIVKQLQKK